MCDTRLGGDFCFKARDKSPRVIKLKVKKTTKRGDTTRRRQRFEICQTPSQALEGPVLADEYTIDRCRGVKLWFIAFFFISCFSERAVQYYDTMIKRKPEDPIRYVYTWCRFWNVRWEKL